MIERIAAYEVNGLWAYKVGWHTSSHRVGGIFVSSARFADRASALKEGRRYARRRGFIEKVVVPEKMANEAVDIFSAPEISPRHLPPRPYWELP